MSKENRNNGNENCGCSSAKAIQQNPVREETQIKVEFLYLDLSVCDPCKTSDDTIIAALDEVASVARAAGMKISLEKIHVESLEQAIALGFQTSPTIRVNGRDLQLDFKEAGCHSCSELSGTETSCRIWEFQGQTYKYLPKAMLVGAILREIYGSSHREKTVIGSNAGLKNLEVFFAAKNRKAVAAEQGV